MGRRLVIYLDNAATTRVDDDALAAMNRYHQELFANPASVHRPGVAAGVGLRDARQRFADWLAAEPRDIVFTSGGTEADNLAVRGGALASRRARREDANVICSAVEHPAVLEACRSLEPHGFSLRLAPVDAHGLVDVDALLDLVDEGTALVSVMHANNEVGTLQPIARIGRLLHARHPEVLFHVDAVQSFLKADLVPREAGGRRGGVHLLSLSSHKIHGPKGVGLLYVAPRTRLRPILYGGGHQRELRPGTENVPGVVGFAAAAHIGWESRHDDRTRMTRLRDDLITRVLAEIPGKPAQRPPDGASVQQRESGLRRLRLREPAAHLEALGVIASAGSACHARRSQVSHVFAAMGFPADPGTIRFTLSRHTTADEIDATLAALREAVPEVRRLR